MLARRIGSTILPLAVLAAAAAAGGSGAVAPGGTPTAAPGSAARHTVDLAKLNSSRWIVQLNGAPLASYRGGISGLKATAAASTGAARLNATSLRSRLYVRHLESVQRTFERRLLRAVP